MRSSLFVVALVIASTSAVAGEVEDRAQKARLHYESGMAHFNLEEWDQAIAEWQDGYRLKPVPEFLYNIAQAYRKSNRADKALVFYQRYLRLDPKAANRPEVERQIEALTKLVDQQREAAKAPPDRPMETAPVAATAPPATAPPATAPRPETATTTTTTTRADLTMSPEKKPSHRKAWVWGVVGGAAAVVAAAVVVGVVLGTKDNTRVLPQARF